MFLVIGKWSAGDTFWDTHTSYIYLHILHILSRVLCSTYVCKNYVHTTSFYFCLFCAFSPYNMYQSSDQTCSVITKNLKTNFQNKLKLPLVDIFIQSRKWGTSQISTNCVLYPMHMLHCLQSMYVPDTRKYYSTRMLLCAAGRSTGQSKCLFFGLKL